MARRFQVWCILDLDLLCKTRLGPTDTTYLPLFKLFFNIVNINKKQFYIKLKILEKF